MTTSERSSAQPLAQQGEPALLVLQTSGAGRAARQPDRHILAQPEHQVIPTCGRLDDRQPRHIRMLCAKQVANERDGKIDFRPGLAHVGSKRNSYVAALRVPDRTHEARRLSTVRNHD